ncbi:MAG: YggT family protein [Pyrinomonadaceae bacterium]
MIVAAVVLMLVRLALNFADLNPFSRPVLFVRRLTDPFINPVRRALVGFGVGPNIAPLITILLVILVGWFAQQLAESILNTAAGVVHSLSSPERGAFVALVGYVLYGLLGFYSLLIFIRIIFSWGMVSYANPVMRFLVNATDPLLTPLRRMMPPLGPFDLSPIVAFIILWLFQAAIVGTILRGWQLNFVS